MSNKLIYAPDTANLEKLFQGDLKCKVTYGTQVCGKPAHWKVILKCCGVSEFYCPECYQSMATTPDLTSWFECSHCHTTTRRWNDICREASRM
jgi:hypothetical protein